MPGSEQFKGLYDGVALDIPNFQKTIKALQSRESWEVAKPMLGLQEGGEHAELAGDVARSLEICVHLMQSLVEENQIAPITSAQLMLAMQAFYGEVLASSAGNRTFYGLVATIEQTLKLVPKIALARLLGKLFKRASP